MAKEKKRHRQKKNNQMFLLRLNLLLAAAIVIVCFMIAVKENRERNQIDPGEIVIPEWIRQELLVVNPYSRAGEPLEQVRDIVVHYVGNPGTTAEQNRNYFNNLAYQSEEPRTSASSHFIIGLDGTIIQCIPLGEVAYANYPRNYDTISIECCHPDETGKFTEETIEALTQLTSWLCEELDLSERHIIRHYDVSGKECPKYYVSHEDEWTKLRKEIKRYRK